jgi:hypothetical protein
MKKKVSEIFSLPYGQDNISCEPFREEIEKAVREKNLEKRGFQEHLDELEVEWGKIPTPERYDHIRNYHAKRIASFVVNPDDHPIKLKKDGREVSEGSHRLRAAIHLGIDEVEVEIEGQKPE